MAWTSLTYAFLSALTSAKMTQNQDNFTAVAQGLSGAPAILKAAIPSVTMYTDGTPVMTTALRVNAGLGVNIAPPGSAGDIAWSGKLTSGGVPLARMATVVVDGSSSVSANTQVSVTLLTAQGGARFYLSSIRSNKTTSQWAEGVKVNTSEAVVADLHSWIERGPTGAPADSIEFVNGSGSNENAFYKIYDLTET